MRQELRHKHKEKRTKFRLMSRFMKSKKDKEMKPAGPNSAYMTCRFDVDMYELGRGLGVGGGLLKTWRRVRSIVDVYAPARCLFSCGRLESPGDTCYQLHTVW